MWLVTIRVSHLPAVVFQLEALRRSRMILLSPILLLTSIPCPAPRCPQGAGTHPATLPADGSRCRGWLCALLTSRQQFVFRE